MLRYLVLWSLIWIAVSEPKDLSLDNQNGTRHYYDNEKYVWKYSGYNYEGIFLQFGESELINADGKCIAEIRPTGNASELRTCLWNAPSCYFFTRHMTDCNASIAKRIVNCKEVTWKVYASLPTQLTLYVYRNRTQYTNVSFSFEYEYVNCSDNLDGSSDDSGITVSDFLSDVIKVFSGDRIIYVLAAGIFFILLSILLTVVIICKSMKIRKLRNTANDSSNISMPDFDPSCNATSSMHSNNIEVFNTNESPDDDVYDRLDARDIEQSTTEKVTKLSRARADPYEDVVLPNGNITAMRSETSSGNERESITILWQQSADQDVYNLLNRSNSQKSSTRHISSTESTCNVISCRNSRNPSVSPEENEDVYDKLNGHLKEQLSDEIPSKEGDNEENPNPSETAYDFAATESTSVAREDMGSERKKAKPYEDVSGISSFGDSQDGNYTNLKLKDSKPRDDGSEFEGGLYDTVERI